MAKIWEPNRLYSFLRPYVDWCTRQSYHRILYWGAELPKDGAVIFAPNHTNTLMDALVILAGRKGPTAFGARADIFRKPAIARILHFLRILPMVRERDGLEHVSENYESFDQIDDVLAHAVPFCMFAEGTHRPERSLQPVKKGIARIAYRSAQNRQTWLVPTGINYSSFFDYRGVCEVHYGEPLNINEFVREHPELNEPQLQQALRSTIEKRMAALVDPEGPAAAEKPSWLLWLVWPLAAFLSLPMWLTAEILCRKMQDKAWCNTVRFGCLLLLLPLTLLIWGIIFCLTPLPWYGILSLLASIPATYGLVYDGLNALKTVFRSGRRMK